MAKVLVVDDDPLLSGTLEDWLMSEKHDVEVVDTGMKGWQKLQAGEYDFVILDWDLPDLNGPDIVKMFRATGATTPVLLLTGRSSLNDKEQGLDCGADDYLTKPFHTKELGARMRAALRKQDSMQAKPKALGQGNEELLRKADLAGTTLAAHYEFIEMIGEGGVGVVFKARNPHLDKLVAVKMLQGDSLNAEVISRFEREARVISKLEHQNIAVLHDFGVTEKRKPFMVMEFIQGRSLKEIIEQEGNLDLPEALRVLIAVCDGLSYAHEMGVLHRDLKPGNIMLKEIEGRQPVPKILDFGCAKLRTTETGKAPDLTQAGQILGSPAYMSPEQIKGKNFDERSDIYSLGCMMFEIFTGRPPYLAETAVEMMFAHIDETAISLKEARPDLTFPEELQHIVSFAMNKDISQRYHSVSALKADLEKIQHKAQSLPNNKTTESHQDTNIASQLSNALNKSFGWLRPNKKE